MLKYITTAVALKVFSSTALARAQYRKLGNSLGGKRRQTESMPAYYPERLKRMLRLQRQHNIVQDGNRILELGTGWLHWEALTLRLFVEIEAVLFEVWDNLRHRRTMGRFWLKTNIRAALAVRSAKITSCD